VCLKRGVPILGICRGHQFLNVYFGGSLYQDIPSQLKAKTSATHRIRVKGVSQPCWHEITILPDTRLFSIMGTSKYNVNSYHHQGVKRLGKGLEAVSYSADGLVEAIEGAGARRGTPQGYLLGVQFHPEKNLKDPAMNRIIKSFIEAGHEFRKLRN